MDLCDRLRQQYGIPDKRPKLKPPCRHRDTDLLPFPLSDTATSDEAMEALGCGFYTLTRLIDEGRIMAYRLAANTSMPWRISRSSVAQHMRVAMRGVVGGPHAYVELGVD